MLVARILREVDAELERLQTARDTIAALIAPSYRSLEVAAPPPMEPANPPEEATPQPEDVPELKAAQEPSPVPASALPRRRGRPKGSVNRQPGAPRVRAARQPEPTALARSVSSGPVFVSAAELEQRRRQPVVIAAPKPVEEHALLEGTLESLIREVAERRTSAAA